MSCSTWVVKPLLPGPEEPDKGSLGYDATMWPCPGLVMEALVRDRLAPTSELEG